MTTKVGPPTSLSTHSANEKTRLVDKDDGRRGAALDFRSSEKNVRESSPASGRAVELNVEPSDGNRRMKCRKLTIQILLAFGMSGCGQRLPAGKVYSVGADAGNALPQDAGNVLPQWWDPECGAVSDTCDSSLCVSTQLVVFASPCGPPTVAAGCVPLGSVTTGWGCWVRGSDGTVIESEFSPSSTDGFETCQAAGLTTNIGFYTPQCPDGGMLRSDAHPSVACPSAVETNLTLPADATSDVVDVSTNGACIATNTPPNGILVGGVDSPTCTVTVRLADGTELQSTVSFETFGETPCPAAVTDATLPSKWFDAGAFD